MLQSVYGLELLGKSRLLGIMRTDNIDINVYIVG
jgi:hypothetical protein